MVYLISHDHGKGSQCAVTTYYTTTIYISTRASTAIPIPLQARLHQVQRLSGGDRPTVVSDCSPVPINPIG